MISRNLESTYGQGRARPEHHQFIRRGALAGSRNTKREAGPDVQLYAHQQLALNGLK